MSKVYETFSLEDCSQWNKRYEKATHDNNKKEIMSLLSEANKLYFDEYFIYSTITKLHNENLNEDEKNKLINNLNKSRIIKFINKDEDYLTINTKANSIKVAKLSDIISSVSNDYHSKESIIRSSQFSSEYLSQLISFPNSIVTGYIYGISDKSKKKYTWLEFKNNYNQTFVVDYADNTVYNKEGFYFLKHAELIKKIDSGEMKGKSTVSKTDNSEISNEFIDIEIDMGDDR